MDFEMKIWDSPKTEKKAIIFFKDKGLLPTTKQCVNGYTTTLTLTKRNIFESVTIGHV